MFNLIKMDLFRLVRTKSFYINLVIIIAFGAIVMYASTDIAEFAEDIGHRDITMLEVCSYFFKGSLIPLIISIGVAIFACADYSSGYIKNVASGVKKKYFISLSKIVTWMIGSLVYYLVTIVALYIFALLFIGDVELGNALELVKYVGMNYFLTIVMVSLTVMLSSIFRSGAAVITGVVVVMQFSFLIYSAINSFLNIDLLPYSVANAFQMLPAEYSDSWTKLLISGTVLLVVYIAGGCVAMEKKDIK